MPSVAASLLIFLSTSLLIVSFQNWKMKNWIIFKEAAPLSGQPYRELQRLFKFASTVCTLKSPIFFSFRNNRQCYFSPITCIQDPQRNRSLQRMKNKSVHFDLHPSTIHRNIIAETDDLLSNNTDP